MNVKCALVYTVLVLMAEIITFAIATLTTAERTVQWNLLVASRRLARTTGSAFLTWKTKQTTSSTALARMDSMEKLVKLSAR